MSKALIQKLDNMQEQMGNISRQIEIRNNRKCQKSETQLTKMQSNFDSLVSKLDTDKESVNFKIDQQRLSN